MTTLLNVILDFSLLEQGYYINLDWLGAFTKLIIEGIGIIGLGIIVFTIILKAITLPFDIYQRVKMRKQSLIMREMQPELDKLKKQYANDKDMYNQKMMELYKKNGYSMLGACLPIIISLVIIIVAFQGFRTYSQYANLNMYVGMSEAYNEAIIDYVVDGKEYTLLQEGEEPSELKIEWQENYEFMDSDVFYYMYKVGGVRCMQVKSEAPSKCIFYVYSLDEARIKKEYKLDTDKLYEMDAAKKFIDEQTSGENKVTFETACKNYMVYTGATAARDWYHDNDASFLWIKNVWYPDVSYSHPIQDYKAFSDQFKNVSVYFKNEDGTTRKESLETVLDVGRYNNLVSELTDETKQPNGYFILIVLSIGLMVLSQFISMRSQKESNKYQTLDGSGAMSQKIMMVIMPIIYAVFAFMYSAAFSIYMTMSSLISILVTLISNFAIERAFKKKEEVALKDKYTRTLPWMQKEDPKKKKK